MSSMCEERSVVIDRDRDNSHRCSNKGCSTILEEGNDCYIHDHMDVDHYCSFNCVEAALLKDGFSKSQIKILNKELVIYYTTYHL